jgi:hypothetical protein
VNPFILQLITVAMKILERHQQANPTAPPLTAEQVTDMLIEEIARGEQRDLAWFLLKGQPPPE